MISRLLAARRSKYHFSLYVLIITLCLQITACITLTIYHYVASGLLETNAYLAASDGAWLFCAQISTSLVLILHLAKRRQRGTAALIRHYQHPYHAVGSGGGVPAATAGEEVDPGRASLRCGYGDVANGGGAGPSRRRGMTGDSGGSSSAEDSAATGGAGGVGAVGGSGGGSAEEGGAGDCNGAGQGQGDGGDAAAAEMRWRREVARLVGYGVPEERTNSMFAFIAVTIIIGAFSSLLLSWNASAFYVSCVRKTMTQSSPESAYFEFNDLRQYGSNDCEAMEQALYRMAAFIAVECATIHVSISFSFELWKKLKGL